MSIEPAISIAKISLKYSLMMGQTKLKETNLQFLGFLLFVLFSVGSNYYHFSLHKLLYFSQSMS